MMLANGCKGITARRAAPTYGTEPPNHDGGPGEAVRPRYGGMAHNRHACLTINRGASQADRAVRERAGGRKPPDRGVMHVETARDVHLRLASTQALDSFLPLVLRDFRGLRCRAWRCAQGWFGLR